MSSDLMALSVERFPGASPFEWKSLGNPFANGVGQGEENSFPTFPTGEGTGNPTNPTIPTGDCVETAIYPRDSILDDWMRFSRGRSENNDFQLLGSILPMVGACLGRRVKVDFFGWKYPNLYSMIVAGPGQRKSTLIRLVEKLARELISENGFVDAITSEEALFEQFDTEKGGNPDQFLIEDEGNVLFTNWAETSYGRQLSKRYLSLYDAKSWSQSFKGNKGEGSDCRRLIHEASASALVGATYNICRLNKLEIRDGMWRRFLKYPSERLARKIYFPPSGNGEEWARLVELFSDLAPREGLEIEYSLTDSAKELYIGFKDRNQEKLEDLPRDFSSSSEAMGSVLAEELSFAVKIAMIFQVCRDARRGIFGTEIEAETLKLAYEHVQQCNDASNSLENISKRAEIRDAADTIRAQVLVDFGSRAVNGVFIPLSKTEITNRFAKNSGRQNSMTNNRLYYEILPDLERRNLAKRFRQPGSPKHYYLFKTEE